MSLAATLAASTTTVLDIQKLGALGYGLAAIGPGIGIGLVAGPAAPLVARVHHRHDLVRLGVRRLPQAAAAPDPADPGRAHREDRGRPATVRGGAEGGPGAA